MVGWTLRLPSGSSILCDGVLVLGRDNVTRDKALAKSVSREHVEVLPAGNLLTITTKSKVKPTLLQDPGSCWKQLERAQTDFIADGGLISLGRGSDGLPIVDFTVVKVAELRSSLEQLQPPPAPAAKQPRLASAPAVAPDACTSAAAAADDEGFDGDDGDEDDGEHGRHEDLVQQLRRDASNRATCGAYPHQARCCRFDASCYSRDVRHWSMFAHPCELSKPYCPKLLSGLQCYNRDKHAHNAQFSHGPLPSEMRVHASASAPGSSASATNSTLESLKDELQELLYKHRAELFRTQHRKSAAFSLVGSFKVGTSTNAFFLDQVRKGNPMYVQHPTRKNKGVYVVPPSAQLANGNITQMQWRVYQIAVKVLESIDPDYAAGEFVVQFAYMNDPLHHVKCHEDRDDVSHQYALTLGNFSGAVLRTYLSRSKTSFVDFGEKKQIVKFDGRLPHEVVNEDFLGDRFTVIFYKNYDARPRYVERDDPIIEAPHLVHESKPVLLFVVGQPGSGKTTAIESFIGQRQLKPETWGADGATGACAVSGDAKLRLLGRYARVHGPSAAGVGDGTDRLNRANAAMREGLARFMGSALVVAEGLSNVTLNQQFMGEAERLGYDVRFRELDTSDEEARRRQLQRDGPSKDLTAIRHAWLKKREEWVLKHVGYRRVAAHALLDEMQGLLA
jgi:hypothetical protein